MHSEIGQQLVVVVHTTLSLFGNSTVLNYYPETQKSLSTNNTRNYLLSRQIYKLCFMVNRNNMGCVVNFETVNRYREFYNGSVIITFKNVSVF